LCSKRKLDIEFMLNTVDLVNGKLFCIRFIDPQTKKFKIILFREGEDGDGIYMPQEMKNEELMREVHKTKSLKFLKRILVMMSYDLKDLY
jgi:hypothetical protein